MARIARSMTQDELNRLGDEEYRDYMRQQLSATRKELSAGKRGGLTLSLLLAVMLAVVLMHSAGWLRFQP